MPAHKHVILYQVTISQTLTQNPNYISNPLSYPHPKPDALRRFEFGLVHAIALSPYQPICGGSLPCAIYNPGLNISGGTSPQYTWLANDLAAVSSVAPRHC